jgi:hypothetical protein
MNSDAVLLPTPSSKLQYAAGSASGAANTLVDSVTVMTMTAANSMVFLINIGL